MRVRFPLYAQTLCMLCIYLAALSGIAFAALGLQGALGWEAVVKSPLGERIDTIADAASSQLRAAPKKSWNMILSSFSNQYGADFQVFDPGGQLIAGKEGILPSEVLGDQHGFIRQFSFGPFGPPTIGFAGKPRFDVFTHLGPPVRIFSTPPAAVATFQSTHPAPPPPLLHPPILSTPGLPTQIMSVPPIGTAFVTGSVLKSMPPVFQSNRAFMAPLPSPILKPHGRFVVRTTNPERYWICCRVMIGDGSSQFPMPALLAMSSPSLWSSKLLIDSQFVVAACLTVLVVSLAIWLPFVFYLTNRLSQLTLATERIAEGNFDTRLKPTFKDEIGRLTTAVNVMAARLDGFVSGQKRFLADVSHELRSPLARLQMATEILSETASPEQRQTVQDIREEVEEMTNLTDELLAFTKAGLKIRDAAIVAIPLKSLIDEVVDRLGIADKVETSVSPTLSVMGDKLLVERSVANILRNSIRYAGEFGPITVTASKVCNYVSVLIADRGPGVPEETITQLTEPFFRPESSRSRDYGGFGLGLAIVKTCVESCDGILKIRNGFKGGLEVEIKLLSGEPETRATGSETAYIKV